MGDRAVLHLVFALAASSTRREAALALARRLGADELFVFVRDAELGVLMPAPGLRQTHPGGPSWRALLQASGRAGERAQAHRAVVGEVDFPVAGHASPCTSYTLADGTTLVFIGPPVQLDEDALAALSLVAALLRAEQARSVAEGGARAAREAAVHASALTGALDSTRTELERALGEAARLNLELQRAAVGEREARGDAEKANRAKDEFLAMLGHELRNPLASIVTALQLQKLRGETRSREQLIIERQVEHVIRLVDDLLDVSRITRGKVELKRSPVEIFDVVARAVETASPLLERHRHHLTVDVPRSELRVDADEGRLVQVISNLLTNSAHYTPPGGDVFVSARRVDDAVELRVRDSGIGIAPEMLPRVFELFTQGERATDRADGGLGLGLALVKNLVTLHGGTVTAHSDGLGQGTELVVRLPLTERAVCIDAADAAARSPSQPGSRAQRILLVDDNVEAAEMLAELLELEGYHVAVAHDGPSALRLVDELRPDTAILDIGLPVMDGYELARLLQARASTGGTRLIALTGYGQPSDRARALAAGFAGHLVKPIDVTQLIAQLDPASRPSRSDVDTPPAGQHNLPL